MKKNVLFYILLASMTPVFGSEHDLSDDSSSISGIESVDEEIHSTPSPKKVKLSLTQEQISQTVSPKSTSETSCRFVKIIDNKKSTQKQKILAASWLLKNTSTRDKPAQILENLLTTSVKCDSQILQTLQNFEKDRLEEILHKVQKHKKLCEIIKQCLIQKNASNSNASFTDFFQIMNNPRLRISERADAALWFFKKNRAILTPAIILEGFLSQDESIVEKINNYLSTLEENNLIDIFKKIKDQKKLSSLVKTALLKREVHPSLFGSSEASSHVASSNPSRETSASIFAKMTQGYPEFSSDINSSSSAVSAPTYHRILQSSFFRSPVMQVLGGKIEVENCSFDCQKATVFFGKEISFLGTNFFLSNSPIIIAGRILGDGKVSTSAKNVFILETEDDQKVFQDMLNKGESRDTRIRTILNIEELKDRLYLLSINNLELAFSY